MTPTPTVSTDPARGGAADLTFLSWHGAMRPPHNTIYNNLITFVLHIIESDR